jgi:hypothetical protein
VRATVELSRKRSAASGTGEALKDQHQEKNYDNQADQEDNADSSA